MITAFTFLDTILKINLNFEVFCKKQNFEKKIKIKRKIYFKIVFFYLKKYFSISENLYIFNGR